MKKFIVGILLFIFTLNVQGQWYNRQYSVNRLNDLSETQLKLALQQTTKKINTGKILTGIGVGSEIIGGVLIANNFCIFSCSSKENTLVTVGTILFMGGIPTMTYGIVKWITNASRKNKIEFALTELNTPNFQRNLESSTLGLSMKIHFW